MTIRFKGNFLENYLRVAPAALAIERCFECEILSRQDFEPPVLDIGCGDGVFASVLFDEQVDLGIDPDPDEVEQARKQGCYRKLIQCPGHAIPEADGEFRTIFSNSVLEHIVEIEPVLVEARRLLAPGGSFYVTVPSHHFDRFSAGFRLLSACGLKGLAERYRHFYDRFWKHYHYYTIDEWRAIFQRAGFRVAAMQAYCPKNICTLNDLLVPLAFPGLVAKILTGRWFFFPSIRRVYSPALTMILKPGIKIDPDLQDGGMLFFTLSHSSTTFQ
jgi:SAM-dependent methyltransferase